MRDCFIRDKFLIFFMIACAFYFRFAILSLSFVNCVHLWPIFVCFSTVLFSLSVEPLLSPTVFTPTIRDLDMCADTVGPLIGYSRLTLFRFGHRSCVSIGKLGKHCSITSFGVRGSGGSAIGTTVVEVIVSAVRNRFSCPLAGLP